MPPAAVRFELGFGDFECAARRIDVGEQVEMTGVRVHLLCFPKCAEGICISPAQTCVAFHEAHTDFALNLACHA